MAQPARPPRGPKPAEARIRELEEQLEFYHLIFNHIYNGVLVTDAQGYITHFNEPYGRFLGVNPAEQIGKHTTEVVENTRMHLVAQTGKPEINVAHRIMGQDMVVQRIPIYKDGEVIAVFGQVMFKNVRDVSRLAKKLRLLESKVKLYEEELSSLRSTRYTFASIVGQSQAIARLKKEAADAAASGLNVLITGESGTGKELFAQAIHHASPRRIKPFVRINCAAIPRDLFEAELFGYARGAFTGARAEGKPGKFELAHGGTVFLDEIGELPLEMQPKLLRVLEEKEFERVGGTKVHRTDFRLIAATNQNLEELMRERRFRKDLYYRISVVPLAIPPLRERPEDVLPLAESFLARLNEMAETGKVRLSPEAKEIMLGYDWPGNVRELYNVLERALATMEGGVMEAADLPYYLSRRSTSPSRLAQRPLKEVVARAEREAVRHALAITRGNKARAAELLGIHRTLLYKKMAKHRLEAPAEA
jgi:PAS domain S-box-containing protein